MRSIYCLQWWEQINDNWRSCLGRASYISAMQIAPCNRPLKHILNFSPQRIEKEIKLVLGIVLFIGRNYTIYLPFGESTQIWEYSSSPKHILVSVNEFIINNKEYDNKDMLSRPGSINIVCYNCHDISREAGRYSLTHSLPYLGPVHMSLVAETSRLLPMILLGNKFTIIIYFVFIWESGLARLPNLGCKRRDHG